MVQKTRGAVKQNPNCAFHKHYSAVRAVVAVYIITPPWPGGGKGAALEIWSRTTHTLLTVKLSKGCKYTIYKVATDFEDSCLWSILTVDI